MRGWTRVVSCCAGTAALLIAAMAPVAAQGRFASSIRVTVGGAMEQTVGYAINRDGVRVGQSRQTGTAAVVVARPNRWGQQSDSEIWFSGRARLDSGLLVGFVVQLEGNTQFNDQIDESYLFVEGAFGRVLIGAENDAAYLHHVAAPRPGDGWGILESAVTGWVVTPRSMYLLTTSAPLSTGDDQKITYFTPRLGGVQLGASFTPNDKQDSRDFSDRARERTNVVSLSASGRWRWEDLLVEASAGWVHGSAVRQATFADRRSALDDIAVGGRLRHSGWSIGAGVRWLRNSDSPLDGRVITAGVAWQAGDLAVGLGALLSRTAGLETTPGSDRGKIFLASGAYRLAPGISAVGSAFAARYSAGTSRVPAEDNNRGVGLVSGIRLSF